MVLCLGSLVGSSEFFSGGVQSDHSAVGRYGRREADIKSVTLLGSGQIECSEIGTSAVVRIRPPERISLLYSNIDPAIP